jgi:hypothetical protein
MVHRAACPTRQRLTISSDDSFMWIDPHDLEVLAAPSLDAPLALIETKQRQMTAAVAAYQALGGGRRQADPGNAGASPESGEQP